MMWMHRLHIDKNALTLQEWADLLGRGEIGHKLIWKAFGDGPDRDRDFIFRLDQQPNTLTFHAICPREASDWDGRFQIQSKPYNPSLTSGQMLQFQIRLNPSIAVKVDGKRGKRRDIIAHAKASFPDLYKDMSQDEIVQVVGLDWLVKKLARHGVEVMPSLTHVMQYSDSSFSKVNRSKRNHVYFTVMDFTGVCRIKDPELAQQALLDGIGRQKSFGMGMLMVKPL